MQLSDFCKECGGKCCRRPWMSTEEYTRLVLKIGNNAAIEAKPVFILGGWQFTQETCPGLTENGCILSYDDRPRACQIYPMVDVPTIEGTKIQLLAIQTCKYWKEFGMVFNNGRKTQN